MQKNQRGYYFETKCASV